MIALTWSKLWQRAARLISRFAPLLTLLVLPSAHAQTFTVLHYFTGAGDGAAPASAPIVGPSGSLYGVTPNGGSFDYGVLYRIDKNGKESLLHNFLGGEGLAPSGGLLFDPSGNLYGTTLQGGTPEGGGCAHGCGTVFKRDASGIQTILYVFSGTYDGGAPNVAMIRDAAGNLYGTTYNGGVKSCYVGFGCGVIFKLDTTNHESVLYSFMDGTDGKNPLGLVADAAGNLYGTTYDGGIYGKGCVFKLDSSGTFTVLYSFTGGADSDNPNGHLVLDKAGNIFGTTNSGLYEASGFGVVFKLDPAGNLTVLHNFADPTDGEYPNSLVMDAAGNLYGVTFGGGSGTGCYYGSCGTVFKLDTSLNKTVLHSFSGVDGQLADGLTMDNAGNLYGTTQGGGRGGARGTRCYYYRGCGVVFKLTP